MANSERPVVDTQTGKLRGIVEQSCEGFDYYAFKGIPYGRPPVGQLRFQDPIPAEPWTGTRDAKDYGPVCSQCEFMMNGIFKGEEDCLSANVFTNNLKPRKKRPVMVWIHGGAFKCGDGTDDMYGADYFMHKDIVLVTINYRLGVLGFLNVEDEASPGNYGLKDQVLALKWVRDNIANFGGDPDNVTIFGESAGSASVHYLCLSPQARGLFHKAIMQSGAVLNPWSFVEDPTKNAYRLCELLGENIRNPKKAVEFLRSIDHQKLIEAEQNVIPKDAKNVSFAFGPSIDAKSRSPFLPIHPEQAYARGVHVPLLIGYNSREGLMFLNPTVEAEKYDKNFPKHIHAANVKYLKEKYDLAPEDLKRFYIKGGTITEDNRDKLADLLGDLDFVLGIHRVVKLQAERGSAPTYLYKYGYDKTQSGLKTVLGINMPGACHADEMQNLFRHRRFELLSLGPLEKGSEMHTLMLKMVELWTNFATYGRPTPMPSELVPFYWSPITDGTVLRYLNIDEDVRMEVMLNLEEHLLAQKLTKNKL